MIELNLLQLNVSAAYIPILHIQISTNINLIRMEKKSDGRLEVRFCFYN